MIGKEPENKSPKQELTSKLSWFVSGGLLGWLSFPFLKKHIPQPNPKAPYLKNRDLAKYMPPAPSFRFPRVPAPIVAADAVLTALVIPPFLIFRNSNKCGFSAQVKPHHMTKNKVFTPRA
jgi:hypothetical protein